MIELLSSPWPWYVSGPLIGLFVPVLLLLTGKRFGISSSLRHICAAAVPGKIEYFNYDWKGKGLWNLTMALGIFIGGIIAAQVLSGSESVAISNATVEDLTALGLTTFEGLVPVQLISWESLLSPAGFIVIVLGGFLIGFGARYAGGCTSGHAITGIANLELGSLVAVIGFFIGGLIITFFLYPFLL